MAVVVIAIVCFEIAYHYVARHGLKIHSDLLAEGVLAGSGVANMTHRFALTHLFLSLSPGSIPSSGYGFIPEMNHQEPTIRIIWLICPVRIS